MSPLLVGGTGRVIHGPWRGAQHTILKQPALRMGSSPTANPLGCSCGRPGERTEIRAALWECGAQKQHRRAGGTDRPLRGEERSSAFLCAASESETVLKTRPASTGLISAVPLLPTSTGSLKNHYPKSPRHSHPAAAQEREAGTLAPTSPSAGPSGVRPCPD